MKLPRCRPSTHRTATTSQRFSLQRAERDIEHLRYGCWDSPRDTPRDSRNSSNERLAVWEKNSSRHLKELCLAISTYQSGIRPAFYQLWERSQPLSAPHITLAPRVRVAVLPTTWPRADTSAAAAAITASGLGGFRLRRQPQRTAGTAAHLCAAAAFRATDGAVIADEQLTLAMRYTALAARAWVVGSIRLGNGRSQYKAREGSPK